MALQEPTLRATVRTMLAAVFEQLGEQLRIDLGARLKAVRERRSLRVQDVAGMTGLTTVYIYSVERGECNPTAQVLASFATVYQVDVADLFVFVSGNSLRQRARDLLCQLPNEAMAAVVAQLELALKGATSESTPHRPQTATRPGRRSGQL